MAFNCCLPDAEFSFPSGDSVLNVDLLIFHPAISRQLYNIIKFGNLFGNLESDYRTQNFDYHELSKLRIRVQFHLVNFSSLLVNCAIWETLVFSNFLLDC